MGFEMGAQAGILVVSAHMLAFRAFISPPVAPQQFTKLI